MKQTVLMGLVCPLSTHTGSDVTQGFHSRTRWSRPAVAATAEQNSCLLSENKTKCDRPDVTTQVEGWNLFATQRFVPTCQIESTMVVHVPHSPLCSKGCESYTSAVLFPPANHKAGPWTAATGCTGLHGAQVTHCSRMEVKWDT